MHKKQYNYYNSSLKTKDTIENSTNLVYDIRPVISRVTIMLLQKVGMIIWVQDLVSLNIDKKEILNYKNKRKIKGGKKNIVTYHQQIKRFMYTSQNNIYNKQVEILAIPNVSYRLQVPYVQKII